MRKLILSLGIFVGAVLGAAVVFGQVASVPPLAMDAAVCPDAAPATLENFTVTVSPGSGSDTCPATLIATQADATRHGAFNSPLGVTACLPRAIDHQVVISVTNGDYTVSYLWLGDYARFSMGNNGHIYVKAATPFEVVSPTTSYALSAGATLTATFASDPGFTANQYRGYFMQVFSGTGSSSTLVTPIRTHTTTAWEVTAWANGTPNNTSVVKIVQPGVRLTISDSDTFLFFPAANLKPGFITTSAVTPTPPSTLNPPLTFEGFTLSAASGKQFGVYGQANFTNCRFVRVSLYVTRNSLVSTNSFVTDGVSGGDSFVNAGLTVSGQMQARQTISRGWTGPGAYIYPWASMDIFLSSTLDNNANGVLCRGRFVYSSNVRATGNTSYGVVLTEGGRFYTPTSSAFTAIKASTVFTGGTTDIKLDGTNKAWTDVDGDAEDWLQGERGSGVGFADLT